MGASVNVTASCICDKRKEREETRPNGHGFSQHGGVFQRHPVHWPRQQRDHQSQRICEGSRGGDARVHLGHQQSRALRCGGDERLAPAHQLHAFCRPLHAPLRRQTQVPRKSYKNVVPSLHLYATAPPTRKKCLMGPVCIWYVTTQRGRTRSF
ncbi:uncharacterized protein LOC119159877 isoform X2 [Rhipicephalus microplus]|uniref:uncharacterized protein LOC119159877 isoform X2 n=1 Tax=Rhipicephalus microplus TaxID=6941 RepID=UPI003F6D66B3